MLLNRLGEFGLIDRFKKNIRLDNTVIKGPGDDCAVLQFDKKRYMLFSCDMILEGVDFLKNTDPYLIGRKSLAISISDIAACGGIPRYAVVSMAIPKWYTVSSIDKLSKGVFDLANEFKVNIVGGDISCGSRLVIDVSIIGLVEKEKLLLRSQAKKGDIIFVTGPLGGSYKSGKHLRFIPRLKEARILVDKYKINAMIDISDGFSQDLNHLLANSSVGAVIYEQLIPVSESARGLTDALYSGEDFELIFTASGKYAKEIMNNRQVQFIPVGEIVDPSYGITLITKSNKEKKILPKGYKHF